MQHKPLHRQIRGHKNRVAEGGTVGEDDGDLICEKIKEGQRKPHGDLTTASVGHQA